ncbi:hypothetical protein Pelo_14619 [Pelomyxa schiedti]|nr:hypothetical protein Pelo_14619 [Pelomyxa schiedti]
MSSLRREVVTEVRVEPVIRARDQFFALYCGLQVPRCCANSALRLVPAELLVRGIGEPWVLSACKCVGVTLRHAGGVFDNDTMVHVTACVSATLATVRCGCFTSKKAGLPRSRPRHCGMIVGQIGDNRFLYVSDPLGLHVVDGEGNLVTTLRMRAAVSFQACSTQWIVGCRDQCIDIWKVTNGEPERDYRCGIEHGLDKGMRTVFHDVAIREGNVLVICTRKWDTNFVVTGCSVIFVDLESTYNRRVISITGNLEAIEEVLLSDPLCEVHKLSSVGALVSTASDKKLHIFYNVERISDKLIRVVTMSSGKVEFYQVLKTTQQCEGLAVIRMPDETLVAMDVLSGAKLALLYIHQTGL